MPDDEKTIAQVEQDLKAAMAADLELVHGQNMVVLDYVFIATVLDEEGDPQTVYSEAANAPTSTILGWLEWLKIIKTETIRRRIVRREED